MTDLARRLRKLAREAARNYAGAYRDAERNALRGAGQAAWYDAVRAAAWHALMVSRRAAARAEGEAVVFATTFDRLPQRRVASTRPSVARAAATIRPSRRAA